MLSSMLVVLYHILAKIFKNNVPVPVHASPKAELLLGGCTRTLLPPLHDLISRISEYREFWSPHTHPIKEAGRITTQASPEVC